MCIRRNDLNLLFFPLGRILCPNSLPFVCTAALGLDCEDRIRSIGISPSEEVAALSMSGCQLIAFDLAHANVKDDSNAFTPLGPLSHAPPTSQGEQTLLHSHIQLRRHVHSCGMSASFTEPPLVCTHLVGLQFVLFPIPCTGFYYRFCVPWFPTAGCGPGHRPDACAVLGLDVAVRKPLIATVGVDNTVRVWNYLERSCEVSKVRNNDSVSLMQCCTAS